MKFEGTSNKKIVGIASFFFGGLITLISGILILTLGQSTYESMVINHVTLHAPNAPAIKTFIEPPEDVIVYKFFYAFNITNTAEILKGADPKVSRTGPFTYRVVTRHHPSNLSWRADGTLRFCATDTYTFVPEESAGREDDIVTTVNMGYVAAYEQTASNKTRRKVVDLITAVTKQQYFINLTVKEFFFGYQNKILKSLHSLIPSLNDVVALIEPAKPLAMCRPSGVVSGADVTENFQKPPLSDVRQFRFFEGQPKLDFWGSDEANTLRGTYGAAFSPNSTCRSTYVFVPELRRSVVANCGYKGAWNGIPALYMQVPMMELSKNGRMAKAYYIEHTGFQPVPPILQIPVELSFPFFAFANMSDPVTNVSFSPSLNPPLRELLFLTFEPMTGYLLQAVECLQINARISAKTRPNDKVAIRFIPLAYINRTMTLPSSLQKKLKFNVVLIPRAILGTGVGMIVFSLVLFGGGLLFLFKSYRSTKTMWSEDDEYCVELN